MTEKSALDAINEALGAEASGAADENAPEIENESRITTDETTSDGEGRDESAVDDPEASTDGDVDSTEEVAKEEGEESPDATITTSSTERNADGTFKKKQDEPKKADPVNDPIPKDLKQETRARMQSLIDTTKEITQKYEKAQQDFDYMINGVQATGTTPEQYGEMLSWMSLFNSGNPEHQMKALELVESVADRLATLLGKERNISDPLAKHEDLKAAVTRREITAEYAKEIARQRNGVAFRTEITTTAQRQQQTQEQAQQTLQTARNDLTALESDLRSVDGAEYDAIKAQIVTPLKPVMAAINPAQWKAKFLEAYKAAKEQRAQDRAARAQVKPKVPTNQPLRGGKNPAGGQARAPSNPLEAMNSALAGMK
jgi:hypothetical protein